MTLLVSRLAFVVVIIIALDIHAQDDFLREGPVQDARQVTCQHPPTGLVVLRLQELGDVTRTAVVNLLDKTCSGNITFHACNISAASVQVVITDLQDGDLRTFTCVATTLTGGHTHTDVIAVVNVTKTGETTTVDITTRGNINDSDVHSQTSVHQEQCARERTPTLIVLIILLLIFGVITFVLFVVYIRARNRIPPGTVSGLDTSEVKVQKVRMTNEYQSSRLPPPAGQAPDAPGRGLVMQYQKPVPLSSGGTLVPATDNEGQGLLQYQEPWGQLDDEISEKLATFRPNPRMCLVPGFQRPADVSEKLPDEKDDNE
ncbi:uncharacterized protein LOC112569165 [Pomacea canaliculata]|uniref:uncharacterized protein LOC112569165 n=1 Tax=Pomacea canaliculata TaxID=400727 RepID=UPI000D72D9C1|nr:uncharacterized protein LOC112569165 [Pomacea canaliculata]